MSAMATPATEIDIMNKIRRKQNTFIKKMAASPQEVPKQTTTRKSKAASLEEGLNPTAITNSDLVSPNAGPQGLKEQLFRSQFKKTQLCRFHTAGKCKAGKGCHYAHRASELNTAPDLFKTSMCPLWVAGECNKNAEDCRFAHGFQDMRMTPLFEEHLLGDRMQKNSTGLGTCCMHEVGMPPKRQKSKTNTLPTSTSDIKSKSATCLDSNQIEGPPTSVADQSDSWCEAKSSPRAASAKAIWVISPAQQWLMNMKVFVVFATTHQQGELVTMLKNAASEPYYD